MKKILCLSLASAFFVGCATTKKEAPAAPADGKAAVGGKAAVASADDLDTYSTVAQVPDPLQPVNRVTFWINHQVYRYVLKPVAIGYKFIIPEKGREAIGNAFENVKYPVRLANNLLQADLPGAGKQTGAFLVNSTVGIGGLGRPAQHIPALADLPPADTAQTFAKWGIPNGFYFVLPLIGPTTLRDGVGLAGDWALNPITWCGYVWGQPVWYIAVPAANTMRSLPGQLDTYEAATKDTIDRYLAARTAYIQYRNEVNSR